jgi:chromosome segregation ATPase
MAKAAGFTIEQVTWLIRVANKGLPELEHQYNSLKTEVDWLETKKQSVIRILEDYNRQVTSLGITLDSYFIRCEQQGKELATLQAKRMKEEDIVRRLETNKAEIRKVVEMKVRILLSNRRRLINFGSIVYN